MDTTKGRKRSLFWYLHSHLERQCVTLQGNPTRQICKSRSQTSGGESQVDLILLALLLFLEEKYEIFLVKSYLHMKEAEQDLCLGFINFVNGARTHLYGIIHPSSTFVF